MTTTGNTKNWTKGIIAFLIMLLCAGTVSIPTVRAAEEPEAEAVVTDFLKAVKEVDTEKMLSFCTDSSADILKYKDAALEKMAKMLFKKFSYKIVFSDSEGDTAKVKLRITNTDRIEILDNVDYAVTEAETQSIVKGKRLTDAEMEKLRLKYFEEYIAEEDAPTSTSEVYVTLIKNSTSETWQIEMSKDFKYAILGQGRSLAETKAIDFLEALKRADNEKIAACFSSFSPVELKFKTEADEKITKMLLKRLEYEIVSSEMYIGSAEVTAKVKYIDTLRLLEGIEKEVFPKLTEAVMNGEDVSDEMVEKLISEFLENSISDGSASTETSDMDFKLVKDEEGENWLIKELDEYVVRAITGYLD